MRIERIAAERIAVTAYNPRKDLQPTDPEYQALQRSLEKWDIVEPLVWNVRSGNLVGGHQRFKILRARGDAAFDVSVVDLSPEDERALNVALNKISGQWDDQALFELLTSLDDGGMDLTLTGFDADELAGLARDLSGPLAFTPTAASALTAAPVTEQDVAVASRKLRKRFAEPTMAVQDVTCPHCGKDFGMETLVKGAEILGGDE